MLKKQLWAAFLAIIAFAAAVGPAGAETAAWLDAAPHNWNSPGMAVPKAPAMQNTQARCRDRESAASSPQQQQLAAGGWKLEQYWPAQHAGDFTVLTALAGYDGMCRPWQFNVFVFKGATFAGTVSPVNMNSREDGQIAVVGGGTTITLVTIAADGTLHASFTRYAASDPLCCPSGGHTPVTYQVQQMNGAPVVTPVQIGAVAAPVQGGAAAGPVQLPKTGGGGGSSPSLLAIGLGLFGLLLAGCWGLRVRLIANAHR